MLRDARLTRDGVFRLWLRREWDIGGRVVVFIMLNPSIGDASLDDPTIRRCITFAQAWGYDGLRIVNLCSFRTHKPTVMYEYMLRTHRDPIANGRDMKAVIEAIGHPDTALVVAAWGKVHPILNERVLQVSQAAAWMGKPLHALQLNLDGSPAHPLYLRGNLKPVPFEVTPKDQHNNELKSL
jgi:hypothetical protein